MIKTIDIDECLTNNGGCGEQATCINTIGSYKCECNEGYSGDGISCSLSTTNPTPTSSFSNENQNQNGKAIGIGVGVTFGFLAFIILVLFILFLIKRRKVYDHNLSEDENKIRFEQEISIMWGISSHTNIITLVGYSEHPRCIITKVIFFFFFLSFNNKIKKLPIISKKTKLVI